MYCWLCNTLCSLYNTLFGSLGSLCTTLNSCGCF